MSEKNLEKEDHLHNWVWSLQKGDKVWIAVEEKIALSEQFYLELYEQSGPCELIGCDEIFSPYKFEVVNNWTLKSGNTESHIVAFSYTNKNKFGKIVFAYECNTRDLVSLFAHVRGPDIVLCTRTFRTKEECCNFCNNYIRMNHTPEKCDSILESLKFITKRVEGIKKDCLEND